MPRPSLKKSPPTLSNPAVSSSSPPLHRIILLLSIAAFSSGAAMRLCDSMLPELAQQFSATTHDVSFTVTAYAIAYGVAILFYGPLGDRLGKIRVIQMACIGCTVASLGAVFVTSLPLLILLRAVAGAASAAIIPLSMAWIGDNVSYEERQTTLSRFLTGTILGFIAGQLIGGYSAEFHQWRFAFAIMTVLFALASFLLGPCRTADAPKTAMQSSGTVDAWRSVLRIRWARTVLFFTSAEGFAVFGAVAFIPLLLHQRFGLALSTAALIASCYGIGGFFYTVVARWMLRYLSQPQMIRTGGLTMAGALGLLAFSPYWQTALVASALIGLGFYMMHSTLQTHATQMAPLARGTAVSLFSCVLFAGQSVGVSLAAILMDKQQTMALPLLAAIFIAIVALGFARLVSRHQAVGT